MPTLSLGLSVQFSPTTWTDESAKRVRHPKWAQGENELIFLLEGLSARLSAGDPSDGDMERREHRLSSSGNYSHTIEFEPGS